MTGLTTFNLFAAVACLAAFSLLLGMAVGGLFRVGLGDGDRTGLARPVPTSVRDRLLYAISTTPPVVAHAYLDRFAKRYER